VQIEANKMAIVDRNFAAIIKQLMSTHNAERQLAEDLFNDSKKQPDLCVTNLVSMLRTYPEADSRALCAVLLRKVRSAPHIDTVPLLGCPGGVASVQPCTKLTATQPLFPLTRICFGKCP
jgi:hypothetical protein